MFKFVRSIRNYFAREAARHEKLEKMFQPGKQVRSVRTGKVYLVEWVDMNAALLSRPGQRFILDWFTPAGTIRTEVADDWDPVAA
ncbi:hypothetical protein WJ96_07020 [Burkholderia ubonensis]|uniref:DUF2829 domain-containing protein n=1 Tax=Burkholderia ubonensis TaxID=101571 RepID=A0AAW3MZ46_9BURK|nr:hypothetical protein [Burkholderia ubonensis]KVP75452.1 hypothetical protein WJ93_08815 [Burkholderia ubonensis]KVP96915.1 hypothetical protein WJ97_13925 [Burkholderia ubonensis]KVP98265.1 hypothetical protein WJ96_07020 [Burkholderia ubonensis]KVZ92963.1 hypothetical protein WL25_18680 [Burkholderia ubonensis]